MAPLSNVKRVTLAALPGGTIVLLSTLTAMGEPLFKAETDVSPTRSSGLTFTLRGTSLDWPSELATITLMGGTGPTYPGEGVNVYRPSELISMVPVATPVAGSTTGTAPEPGVMRELQPGTMKPVTEAVVPAGATTAASALLVMAVPGGVVTAMGGATSGVAAQRHQEDMASGGF